MRVRFTILLACFVAAAAMPSSDAVAAPIDLDNDVNISWEDALAPHVRVEVVGAPRLVPNASNVGSLVIFDIDILLGDDIYFTDEFGNVIQPPILKDLIHTINLFLPVGNALLEEVVVGGAPLVLSYTLFEGPGESFEKSLAGASAGIIPLSAFKNFDKLPAGDITFSVQGDFIGLDSGDLTGRITVSGPGTALAVPDPSTLSLLLVGVSLAGIGRRRHKRIE